MLVVWSGSAPSVRAFWPRLRSVPVLVSQRVSPGKCSRAYVLAVPVLKAPCHRSVFFVLCSLVIEMYILDL